MKHGGDIYRNKVKIDFSVNTNPFGMPDSVRVALEDSIDMAQCYPDPSQEALRNEIAVRYHVDPEQIVCGNGASELFTAIANAFQPKKAILIVPGFAGYKRSLLAVDCEIVYYQLRESDGFELTEDLLSVINEDVDLLYLACPNNPTGRMIDPQLFYKIMERATLNQVLVVLDVCFFELMDEVSLSFMNLITQYENLILVNAFTKSMAMAGVRIGFSLCGNNKLNDELRKRLPEWNVSLFAQNGGIAAARNWSYASDSVKKIQPEKQYLIHQLKALGITVFKSDANFILFKVSPKEQLQLQNQLQELLLMNYGILIRDCSDFDGLTKGFYRIAVKKREENEILINALRELFGQASGIDIAIKDVSIEIEHVLPSDIERNSMLTIIKELEKMGVVLDPIQAPVIKRCIHTTADFEYARTLRFSENAIQIAKDLIRNGADIVTDTNMGLSGINKKELGKYGGSVHCFMADADVAVEAKRRGVTRATVSMEKASLMNKPVIFAVGNAPTALIELSKMMEEGQYHPAFVIGVPVGFVNVIASKELIMKSDVPFIVNEGRKGGSNVAAAICNALLYALRDEGE